MGQQEPSNKNDDIENLLKLAEQPASEDKTPDLDPVKQWIIALGIKEGTTRITSYQLYQEYRKWAKKPVGSKTFWSLLSKHFPVHRNPDGQYYVLDPAPFDMSQDTYFKMRKHLRERREYKKRYGKRVGWEDDTS